MAPDPRDREALRARGAEVMADGGAASAGDRALRELGYQEVTGVSFGQDILVDLDVDDETEATGKVVEMCERLLANPVIESYTVERVS